MSPNFTFFSEQNIQNLKTKKLYKLTPTTALAGTQDQIISIVEACSSPEIYHWLFKNRLPDGYKEKDAHDFLNWAKTGWETNKYFVFVILTSDNLVVGALDIKSDDLEAGEIGYYVISSHSGLASTAVTALKEIAKKAGYKKLYAQIKQGNSKSEVVLSKNGFLEDINYKKNPNVEKGFVVSL